MARPPLIVIGMGRSGTRLLVAVLEQLGVRMGVRQDINGESLLFQRANIALLDAHAASWREPERFVAAAESRDGRAGLAELATERITGRGAAAHMGWPLYMHHRSLYRLPVPWGWKDPRNTFTLPVWLELFPGARVIHLTRHGIDVAASLTEMRRRHHERPRGTRGLLQPVLWRGRRIPVPMRTARWAEDMSPFATLESGLQLWATYMSHARSWVRSLGEHAMELSYEALVADPDGAAGRLGAVCGLSPPRALAQLVDPGRAFAYRADPTLVAVARAHAELLGRHGYEP